MKKLLFGFVLVAALAAHADSYLYWMMDSSVEDYAKIQVTAIGSGTDWKATPLQLAIDGSDGYLTIADNYVTRDEAVALAQAGYGFYVNLGDYTGDAYTYYIELLNDGGSVLAHSTQGLTWNAAQNYLAKSAMEGGGTTSGSSWSPSGAGAFSPGASPVPEPTSGMMLVLGMAALALRRRRRA